MRLRLTIQEMTQREGGFEDEGPERWAQVRVEWFKVEPLSSRELVAGQSVNSQLTHKAECSWFENYNSDGRGTELRLVTGDGKRRFNVASVANRSEGNRRLDWMLTEVQVPSGE